MTCAQFSLNLSFSSGRVQGALLNTCPSDNPRGSNHTDLNLDYMVATRICTGIATGNEWTLCDAGTWSEGITGPLELCEVWLHPIGTTVHEENIVSVSAEGGRSSPAS